MCGNIICVFFREGTFFSHIDDILINHIGTDTFYTGRNTDACEIITKLKRTVADTLNSVLEYYRRQGITVCKCVPAYVLYISRNH